MCSEFSRRWSWKIDSLRTLVGIVDGNSKCSLQCSVPRVQIAYHFNKMKRPEPSFHELVLQVKLCFFFNKIDRLIKERDIKRCHLKKETFKIFSSLSTDCNGLRVLLIMCEIAVELKMKKNWKRRSWKDERVAPKLVSKIGTLCIIIGQTIQQFCRFEEKNDWTLFCIYDLNCSFKKIVLPLSTQKNEIHVSMNGLGKNTEISGYWIKMMMKVKWNWFINRTWKYYFCIWNSMEKFWGCLA